MVLTLKTKISLFLLGLGLTCGSIYAAHGDETPLPVSNDINVTAPEQSGIWSFGVTAVLMQPANTGYNYADRTNATVQFAGGNPVAEPSNSTKPLVLDESYYWWFGADVSYAFPGNGRDVTLAYEGLHGTSTDSASNNYNNDVPQLSEYHLLLSAMTVYPITSIQAETDTQYDAGDLLFGQKLDVGQRIHLHPFIGLRYAHIDVNNSFKDTLEPFPITDNGYNGGNESGEIDSTFNGIGPRLGSDANVTLGNGFSVHGRLGLSALIGSQKYNESYTQTILTNNAFTPPTVTYTKNQDSDAETRVIPEIDGRLGLNYSHSTDSNMTLGLEAGWQVTDYFQAIANPSLVNGNGNSFTPARQGNTDFGLQGPYARLQLDLA